MQKIEVIKKKRVVCLICTCIIALMFAGCTRQGNEDKDSQSLNQQGESTEHTVTEDTEAERQEDETQSSENAQEDEQDASQQDIQQPEPSDDYMVLVLDYIPDMVIDLKYATTDNFTGQVIYENSEAYLRYGTVKKLMQVQEELKEKGYKLVLWDGYRPVEAQFKLWDICPDPTYVSNPNKGFSKHSRGNTVDITIVTLEGQAVEMPTGFDDFTKEADRDYSDVSATAAANSQLLEDIMTKAGFKGYRGEWWHYSDSTEYPVVQ